MIHWDDLALLRAIKDHEDRTGHPVWDPPGLMRELAGGQHVDDASTSRFVHELTVAQKAGLLDFRLRSSPGIAPPRPDQAGYWLQNVDDLHLTIAGRDRAMGRVFQTPHPDPNEDDGRGIASLTLEKVAREIGDVYTGSQLITFLEDSGIPAEFIHPFEGTKWKYVHQIFLEMLEYSSASRRTFRRFLGAWMSDELDTGPGEESRLDIAVDLARQGWHVEGGFLVVGERVSKDQMRHRLGRSSASRDPGGLHASLQGKVLRMFDDGHRQAAVLEAFKLVNNRVKELAPDLNDDGKSLMGRAFGGKAPPLPLNDGKTASERDEQDGFAHLFMGAMAGIRNPKAHDPFVDVEDDRAADYLAFASLLLRRLDDVEARLEAEQS